MFIGDDNCISAQRPAMLEIAQVRFRSAMAKNTCRLRLKSETPPGGPAGFNLGSRGGTCSCQVKHTTEDLVDRSEKT